MSQGPEDGDIAEDHEDEGSQDHDGEGLFEVWDVPHTLGGGVRQCDEPHHGGTDRPVLPVLELGEGDGVAHGHVAVHADAGEKEGRGVLHSVEEAQDVPGGVRRQIHEIGELQRRDKAKESVQDGQVQDEDV